MDIVKIGFWKSPQDRGLPMPVAQPQPALGQQEFLNALENVEQRLHHRGPNFALYRGWSTCRICGMANGSGEFTYEGFVWPSGYRHYVEAHNVDVPVAFHAMIIAASRKKVSVT